MHVALADACIKEGTMVVQLKYAHTTVKAMLNLILDPCVGTIQAELSCANLAHLGD